MLREFINDALGTISNLLTPLWNGEPNRAYELAELAGLVSDRCKIYDFKLYDNQQFSITEFIEQTTTQLKKDIRFKKASAQKDAVEAFIVKWENTLLEYYAAEEESMIRTSLNSTDVTDINPADL